MPLRDHFHSPWQDQNLWEGFHSAWANTIVRHLNLQVLPSRYRAVPQVHLGAAVEADVAAIEELSNATEEARRPYGSINEATWAAPQPTQTLEIQFPLENICEVRVLDTLRNLQLVGVVELVSPGNKDRPEHRQAFVSKCAAYLRAGVGLSVVDVVTSRRANLHDDLLEILGLHERQALGAALYAISYRARERQRGWVLDTWPEELRIGQPLPTLPLWLGEDFSVPLALELAYRETCQVLRIPDEI